MSKENKRYLGDAVYAHFDGYHIVLTTSDGITDTNTIALDPTVVAQLNQYIIDLKTAALGPRGVIENEAT